MEPTQETLLARGRTADVYERVNGTEMLASMLRRPWTIGRRAREFAALHARINAVQADGLPRLKDTLKYDRERAVRPTRRSGPVFHPS